jgi:hypothetical protein
MKTRAHISLLILLALIIFASSLVTPSASAQGDAWGEVLNKDGSINFANLTDGGLISQPADWMPNIPLYGPLNAEYHVYFTPSGNSIVIPTNTTLFFMAKNPQESGYGDAASQLGNGRAALIEALAGAFPEQVKISSPETFFQDVISGKTDIWSLAPDGVFNFINSLSKMSDADGVYQYNTLLLYVAGQCATAPGGCSAEQLAILTPMPTVIPTLAPVECPQPSVRPGAISASGNQVAPAYPLVVGQDLEKRGADFSFSASVAPTLYTYYTQEPIEECVPGATASGQYNCTKQGAHGHLVQTGFQCIVHSQSYSECIASASASILLTQSSRNWILNELSIRYPGAFLHHPSFEFSGSGCAWSASPKNVQIADPGYWDVSVRGNTSGTPVSGPRSFARSGDQFAVWLKEITIIK